MDFEFSPQNRDALAGLKKDTDFVIIGSYLGDKDEGSQITFVDCIVGEQLTGIGTRTFQISGEKFVGMFKDGKFNGQGTYTWDNGQKYVGEFKDGEMTGPGTLTMPDGRVKNGRFKNHYFVEDAQK